MTGEASVRSLSRGPWLASQIWEDLLLAHWPVDLERVRAAVPAPIPIDTFAGQAWLSVVPLAIRGSRLRLTPPPPFMGWFPEVNLRTYGSVGGRPGIVFLSLDADNPLFVALVRALYRLPYLHARIRMRRLGATVEVQSRRTDGRAPAASFEASYRAVGDAAPAVPGSLEHWLVERYRVYAVDRRGRVLRAEIRHPPWLLQPGEAALTVNELGVAYGLDLSSEPALVHVVLRQHAVFWAPMRTRADRVHWSPEEGHCRAARVDAHGRPVPPPLTPSVKSGPVTSPWHGRPSAPRSGTGCYPTDGLPNIGGSTTR